MRYIRKGRAPQSFSRFARQQGRKAPPDWDDLRNPEKAELHRALLAEQRGLCCYCCDRVGEADSHVEHLVARITSPARTFQYSNLLASCNGPAHCGHVRNAEPVPVSPLSKECERAFVFSADGRVRPRADAKSAPVQHGDARRTIAVLRLDCKRLQALRRGQIRGVVNEIEAFPPAEQARKYDEALREYRGSASGRSDLPRFCVAMAQVLASLAS